AGHGRIGRRRHRNHLPHGQDRGLRTCLPLESLSWSSQLRLLPPPPLGCTARTARRPTPPTTCASSTWTRSPQGTTRPTWSSRSSLGSCAPLARTSSVPSAG